MGIEGFHSSCHTCIQEYREIETVLLYGSRAKRSHHAGSDIDITIKGEQVNDSLIGRLEDDIDEILLPYSFDISWWERIDNPDLLRHIDRVGVVIYKKN